MFKGRKGGGGGVDVLFEEGDFGGADAFDFGGVFGIVGGGEVGTESEELALELCEKLMQVGVAAIGIGQAEVAVEFVDGAVGFDAQVIFGYAAAVEQGGLAAVSGFGVYLHTDAFVVTTKNAGTLDVHSLADGAVNGRAEAVRGKNAKCEMRKGVGGDRMSVLGIDGFGIWEVWRMATILFGGTFDPVHHGHLITAQAALEALRAERLVFIPANVSPHKSAMALGASGEDRVAMLRLAIEGVEAFSVDDLEVRRAGPSYTIDTVRALRAGRPGERLILLLGADQLKQFHHWHEVRELLGLVEIAVLGRPGSEVEGPLVRIGEVLGSEVEGRCRAGMLATPLIDLSATEIRNRVSGGLAIRYRVPRGVEEYIRGHGLYGKA